FGPVPVPFFFPRFIPSAAAVTWLFLVFVIPAKAGIHFLAAVLWIPAFAGMTGSWGHDSRGESPLPTPHSPLPTPQQLATGDWRLATRPFLPLLPRRQTPAQCLFHRRHEFAGDVFVGDMFHFFQARDRGQAEDQWAAGGAQDVDAGNFQVQGLGGAQGQLLFLVTGAREADLP